MVHRLYSLNFDVKPNIIEKNSYFIPSGYDNLNVLNSFDQNGDLSRMFNDRIMKVKTKTEEKEEEMICEDPQVFLKKWYGTSSQHQKAPTKTMETEEKNQSESKPKNEDLIKLIKEKERQNLTESTSKKQLTENASTTKTNANDFLKKRLDALRKKKE